MMRKEMSVRGIVGFFAGVTIGTFIPIVSSLIYGDGNFYPVNPGILETFGNEINAVLAQSLLCGLLGVCFGAGSIIWEMDDWSILKQTILHLLLSSVVMFPLAYVMQWMEHSVKGILTYVGIFSGIYACIWIVSYLKWWGRIRKLNNKMKENL